MTAPSFDVAIATASLQALGFDGVGYASVGDKVATIRKAVAPFAIAVSTRPLTAAQRRGIGAMADTYGIEIGTRSYAVYAPGLPGVVLGLSRADAVYEVLDMQQSHYASTGRHDTKSRLALRSAVSRVLKRLGFVDQYGKYHSDYHYTSVRRDTLASAPDETLLKLTLWAYLVDQDDRARW